MPVPREFGSLYFNGNKITSYLKSLEYYYKDYRVKDDTKKKERTTKYSRANKKQNIKILLEFKDFTSQEDFKKILLKEYYYQDTKQLFYTISYLEEFIKDFKRLTNNRSIIQAQIYIYYYKFQEISLNYKKREDITKKALTFKFLYILPIQIKLKTIRFAAKEAKFNPNNIKTFRKIYIYIEDYCIIIRDIEDLVQK